MKKNLFLIAILLSFNFAFSQSSLLVQAPLGPTTTQLRAPNGTSGHAYLRACSLVLASELTNLPSGSTVSSFGFTLSTGTGGSAVAGNFTLYLQNTTDVSYQKGTTWSTILTGMTTAYASAMTIPGSAGSTSITLTLSTPFNYTGGGIYVAYDWNSGGPFTTGVATYYAEGTALSPGGCSSASGITSPATTLGTTAFRPSFLFGVANPNANDMSVTGIEAQGTVPAFLNAPQVILGIVKNTGNATLNNVPVSLNITGANPFTDTQTITTLASGASATVSFAAFNPLVSGLNTISVSVPADNVNSNNAATFSQNVTCSNWAKNPASGSYTAGVGFQNGSGILVTTYSNSATTTLTAMRAAISTDTASPGNSVYGALLDASGVVLATTNTFVITSAMLGTFQQVTFATPQNLNANTTYYYGFAQTANLTTAYFPAGTQAAAYLNPNLYYTSALTGGVYTPLGSSFGFFGLEAVLASTVTLSVPSQTVSCGTTATLNATSNATYSWSTGATTSSIAVTPTLNSVYSVTATSPAGCIASKNVSLTVTPLAINASAAQTVTCGNAATLTALSSSNYSWSTGATTSSIVVSPTVNTVYTVTANNAAGCSSSVTAIVSVTALPVHASINATTICPGAVVTVSATGASSYIWSTVSGTVATGNTFTDLPAINTTYSVVGTNAAGCQALSTIAVTVYPAPNVAITTTTQAICLGSSVNFTASGASTYTWNTTGNPSAPMISDSPVVTTEYILSGTDAAGCTNIATTTITVNSVTLSISGTTAVCLGNSATLTASGTDNFVWNNTFAFPEYHVTPTVTATYTVTGTDLTTNCSATETVVLIVNPKPTVTASATKTVICKGENLTITAAGALTYSWTSNSLANPVIGSPVSIIVSPTVLTTHIYSVTGTDANGCVNKTTFALMVDACNGIKEVGSIEKNILIFPNPNNGVFTVSFKNAPESATVEIYTSLGALIKKQILDSDETLLDLKNESNGIYFMTITDKNKIVHTSKLVKQ